MTRSEGPPIQPSRVPLPRSPSDGLYSTLPNHDRRNPYDTSSPASPPGRKRRRMPLPMRVDVKAYDPGEFVQHELLANNIPANYHHDQTHLSIDTNPMLNRSFSSDGPSTPSTPATALTETSTQSSQMMSRNGSMNSVNNSLTQGFNMLRVNSCNSFTKEVGN